MPCDIIRLVKWVGNLTVVDVEVLCFLKQLFLINSFLTQMSNRFIVLFEIFIGKKGGGERKGEKDYNFVFFWTRTFSFGSLMSLIHCAAF